MSEPYRADNLLDRLGDDATRQVHYDHQFSRERVIAGADCGFASFAGSNEVHPSIVWAKFKSLLDGSRIASKQLWKS